ncbi:hypothetical protein HDU83_007935 [Entophlyctis luteolus]|nr:hypothetical protein HDU83_007935 [Entophlyctis luteolus]
MSSMALLAAMQQEHDRMVQNQQQMQQQQSVPSMAKRHSIGATPSSTSAGTPNTSQRSGAQTQQQQKIAELEWELKKNADLPITHQLSQQSLTKNSVPQPTAGSSNNGGIRAGRSREVLRNFMTSTSSAENQSNNSWQGVGIAGAPSAQDESASGLRARSSSISNHSRYNQSQGQQHQQQAANTVTPTPPRTPFFSWRTARTPYAPTGQPTAFPYLPWISSGGSTATSPAGSVLHVDSDAPPMPQIPAAFRAVAAGVGGAGGGSLATLVHVGPGEAFSGAGGGATSAAASGGEKSASSMGVGGGFGQPIELERKKSNSTLGGASVGGTSMSRIKSSLKKSGSSFWLGRDG